MLGSGCPDRHALLRITSPKLRRPRRLLPSRERVRSPGLRGQSGRQRRGVGFHPSETPAAGSRQLPRGANRPMILPPTIAGICQENGEGSANLGWLWRRATP
jgi:hypothetical protein